MCYGMFTPVISWTIAIVIAETIALFNIAEKMVFEAIRDCYYFNSLINRSCKLILGMFLEMQSEF